MSHPVLEIFGKLKMRTLLSQAFQTRPDAPGAQQLEMEKKAIEKFFPTKEEGVQDVWMNWPKKPTGIELTDVKEREKRVLEEKLVQRCQELKDSYACYAFFQTQVTAAAGEAGAEQECPICMEDFQNKDMVITQCAHVYCKKCADDFMKQPSKECPNCRAPLQNKDIYALEVAIQQGGM